MNGAQTEFEEFYREYYPRLLKVLIVFAGGRVHLAEEALDDAMVVVYQKWGSIDNPPAYVYRVAIHKLLRQLEIARREIPSPLDRAGEQLGHVSEQTILEQQQWVVWLLRRLPPGEREALAGTLDELTSVEIAELVGRTPAAVRQNLSAARRRLRKYLADNYGAEITAATHGEEAR
jgi:RNA polymerase sigma factor (sigma-70 family)